MKIFAEATKTNTSLRTISFGCYKTLDDTAGMALLNAVDPFSQSTGSFEWDRIKRSNHTLQSIYIYDRPNVTMNKVLVERLRSISSLSPHRNFQSKCWRHIEKNIEDTSHLELSSKCMPMVLAFVLQHGTMDHLFRLIRSRYAPDLFTFPTPERARLLHQMKIIEHQNRKLRELLESEREASDRLREENHHLRTRWFQIGEDAKKCCFIPHLKLIEIWTLLIELLRGCAV